MKPPQKLGELRKPPMVMSQQRARAAGKSHVEDNNGQAMTNNKLPRKAAGGRNNQLKN